MKLEISKYLSVVPVSKVTLIVPDNVTSSLKVIVILISVPKPYEPSGFEEVISVIVGAVVSITIA